MLSTLIMAVTLLAAPGDAVPLAGEGTETTKPVKLSAAELATQVRRLVRALSSEELSVRTAAEQDLIKLGPAALDLLPETNAQTPAEVRERLGRVELALQAAAAKEAAMASRVTLSGKELAVSAVLAALAEQTGNEIVDYREQFGQEKRDAMIDVDFRNTPYWQALDHVLDAAGLEVYNYSGKPGVTALVARQPGALSRSTATAYQGIFRFQAEQLTAVRDLRRPLGSGLTLQLGVTWEPRVLPITLQQPLTEITALDDQGRALLLNNQQGTLEIPIESSVAGTELTIPFQLPSADAKQIASLRGILYALVPGRKETFRFDKLDTARDVDQRKAGVSVLLQSFRKNGDIYDARILVRYDQTSGALESHRGWIFKNQAYLLDAKGEKIENAGFETTRQGPTEIGLGYKFVLEEDPANYRFVYETPSALLKLPIEYEIKNLELP